MGKIPHAIIGPARLVEVRRAKLKQPTPMSQKVGQLFAGGGRGQKEEENLKELFLKIMRPGVDVLGTGTEVGVVRVAKACCVNTKHNPHNEQERATSVCMNAKPSTENFKFFKKSFGSDFLRRPRTNLAALSGGSPSPVVEQMIMTIFSFARLS